MKGVPDTDSFNRLVAALEPWLDQIVIVGGWAHQLYRLHPDTDIAMPAKLPVTGQDIRKRLLAEGFAEEFMGDDRPQKYLASRHFFDAETRRRRDKRREHNKTPLCVASASPRLCVKVMAPTLRRLRSGSRTPWRFSRRRS
jgi:hypothetical protein